MALNIGIITYDTPHLKTEQVYERIHTKGFQITMFALPFTARKPRETLISHRPAQSDAISPQVIAEKHQISYIKCADDTDIDNSCDLYLVLGAGILSPECVRGKKIINCHPGIIPASRGLDSFKWAIYEMKPLGITLHYIDENVDAGEIISIIPTNVYITDSINSLARRHYESEIDCLSRFTDYMENPQNPFDGIDQGEARMRMPLSIEKELEALFSDYTKQYGKPI